MNKMLKGLLIAFIILVLLLGVYLFITKTNLIPKKFYTAKDFGIETIKSELDFNKNGVDDYTDILLGARQDAENKPTYKSEYYAGGYPPITEGVCTDLVWRALQNAGYSIKDMIDKDIKENINLYPRVEGIPDPNIDFRRVPNLKVFFDRILETYTLNPYHIEDWQPGDIVIFGTSHIGIISDKRNNKGVPYLIHNGGQYNREEDALIYWNTFEPITGHYRWQFRE